VTSGECYIALAASERFFRRTNLVVAAALSGNATAEAAVATTIMTARKLVAREASALSTLS